MAPETSGSKKQRCKAGADMINNLPSNLVQQILESLPLTDAARTSVLSRDWRYKWLSVPHITLDLRFSEALRKRENAALDFPRVYSDAVNKIFLRHRGPILKFVFHVPCHLPKASDIDCWIEHVCLNGVKEFYLYDHRLPKLKPPSCLFSCMSMTHLTLFCGSLSLPSTFGGFPCLISLKLHTCEDDNQKLESLIHNCPQLQSLDLNLDEAISCLTIRALKLQDFVLSATVPRLRLEETARIRTLALDIGGVDLEICDMVELLGSLPNIEKLQLSYFYGCQLHPPRALTKRLERLHTLVLGMPLTCHYTISLLLCLFKSCPSLSRIQIEALKCGSCGSKMLQVEGSCRLESLKHVELLSISGLCSEMKLVKFLLGHSPVLEFMSIGINKLNVKGSDAKLNLAKEVMRYRRVSPYAEVDLKP